jgi:hypothetical protein
MKTRIWTFVVGLAAVAAVIAVPAALAAYTSPKLEVTQTGSTTTIRATLDPNDDPTASLRILAPTGTQLTTNQAPGTQLGAVEAIVKALDLGGADLPVQGQVVVAAPGQVSAAFQATCTQGVTPIATWLLSLSAAGQALNVPAFLVPTTGAQTALGPAYIQVCLGPPDVPPGTPNRATFGIKVYSVGAVLNGVFSTVSSGAWVSFWTPYNPGVGTVNQAGTVAAPAVLAPGAVSLTARKAGKGATLAGRVTQGGVGRTATVTIVGGAASGKLKSLGRARVAASGAFTFRAKAGTFFRATAVAAAGASTAACSQVGPAVAPIPCVNGTVNGFRAQSKVVKKR